MSFKSSYSPCVSLVAICCCVVLLLCSCSSASRKPAGKAPAVKKSTTSLYYLDGLLPVEGLGEVNALGAPGIVLALVAAGLDFGISSLKSWLQDSAKDYEVKTSAGTLAHFSAFKEASTPWAIPSLEAGGVFLFVKTAEIAADTNGVPLDPAFKPFVLSAKGSGGPVQRNATEDLAKSITRSLRDWIGVLEDPPTPMQENVLAWAKDRLEEAGEQPGKSVNRARVLAFAAVLVLQPTQVDSQTIGGKVAVRDEHSFVVDFVAYSHPLVQSDADSFEGLRVESKKIESVFTLLLESPLGGREGGKPTYEVAIIFPVKTKKGVRGTPITDNGDGDSSDIEDPWWVYFADEARPRSKSIQVAGSQVLNAKGTLVETSNLKKTLEALAEFVGKIKLKPEHLGFEED